MVASSYLDSEGVSHPRGFEDNQSREIVETFSRRRQEILEPMSCAIGRRNRMGVELTALALQSTLAIFGAPESAVVARTIEKVGRDGPIRGAGFGCLKLTAHFRHLGAEKVAVGPAGSDGTGRTGTNRGNQ